MFQNFIIWIASKFVTVDRVSSLIAGLIVKLLEYARNKSDEHWDTAKKIVEQNIKWSNLFLQVYEDDTLTEEEEKLIANEIAKMTDEETIKKILEGLKKQ